jgi:uncharacterized protein
VSLYVDASAFLKLYLDEPNSEACERLMSSDPAWLSARHTEVEVRRNLTRALGGQALATAREQFSADWTRTNVIELDGITCTTAAELAEATGARTLDALHIAAAQRARNAALQFLTYDLRQAQVARTLGWSVVGA